MYVIVKHVAQFKYYWNEKQDRWEGLIDNASTYSDYKFTSKILELEGRFNEKLSYIKM